MSLVNDIVQSVLTPGYTAKGVIRLLFYSFYALFATLFGLVIATDFNGHVIALLLLAICLFLTIRWFIAELEAAKKAQASKKE
ncbi:hypothetical protein VTP01DRAFT_10610 [Rhizomucor pusillus]|uniref:uncharacterized protein n=1 Tax=Rhizomucor pusillus TaxID=4840 RepID=UPI003742AAFD